MTLARWYASRSSAVPIVSNDATDRSDPQPASGSATATDAAESCGRVGHGDFVLEVDGLRDGRIVSAGYDKTVQIWRSDDLRPESILIRTVGSSVQDLVELVNGNIVEVDRAGRFVVWNPAEPDSNLAEWDAAPASQYTDEKAYSLTIDALNDGRIVSGWTDGLVRIFNPDDLLAPVGVYADHQGLIMDVEVLTDGRVASAASDGTVRIWDPDEL